MAKKKSLMISFSFKEWLNIGSEVITFFESMNMRRDKDYYRIIDSNLSNKVLLYIYDEKLYTLLKLKYTKFDERPS